jgi:hypothetical protein
MLAQTDLPGAACVYDWYYRGSGIEQLAQMLPKYPQLPVTGILKVLVARLDCRK